MKDPWRAYRQKHPTKAEWYLLILVAIFCVVVFAVIWVWIRYFYVPPQPAKLPLQTRERAKPVRWRPRYKLTEEQAGIVYIERLVEGER